jgi:imidazole glycerol-phosphate synthase subunit HisH
MKAMNITILKYGSANYISLVNFINNFLKFNVKVSDKKKDIVNCDLLILPGVGTFEGAIEQLKKKKIDKVLEKIVLEGKPTIGICLGMQILFEFSEESKKNIKGLSFIKGKTKKLDQTNVGWRKLVIENKSLDIFNNSYFYFNHSYHQICKKKNILAYIKINGLNIPAIIKKKNIIGLQFHPENSQTNGILLFSLIIEQLKKNEYN